MGSTLRHLATGDSYRIIFDAFKMSHNIVYNIIKETLSAINDEDGGETNKLPTHPNS